jgi:hypothetical protein
MVMGSTFLPMPALLAQDFSSSPYSFDTSTYLPLTPEVMDKVITIHEYTLNATLTPDERQAFTDILIRHWESDGGRLQQTIGQLLPAYDQLMQMPDATRQLSRRANTLTLLLGLAQNAEAQDEVSILMLQIYRRVHPPLLAEAPFVSAEVADAFIDAYLFVNEVKSSQNAPAISEATRSELRLGVAADFARMPSDMQHQFIGQMQRVTQLMLNWGSMEPWEQLLTRAEVGAPLSLEEQQMVQQIQQQVSGHSIQLLSNELNYMAQNQQIIMGSAPYWNPASQAWEQTGGIVTEFH